MLTDLPNLLTLSRIAAIPVLVVLTALHTPTGDLAALLVFALAGITDYLDGRLARDRRQTSDVGRMLDPIADKLLVGAALMLLAGQSRLSVWGLYPAIIILLREILVSGLREYLAGLRVGLPVTSLAKWKTGFQMGALGTLIAGNDTAVLIHLSFLPTSTFIGEDHALDRRRPHAGHRLGLSEGWPVRHATSPSSAFPRRIIDKSAFNGHVIGCARRTSLARACATV